MQNLLTPKDALVAEMIKELDADLREDFEERAAIIEFDAKLPRAHDLQAAPAVPRLILRNLCGDARYGESGFSPVFEVLEEHAGFYELVFVPGDGDFGIVIFIPKQQGIDPELLAMCAEYAVPVP